MCSSDLGPDRISERERTVLGEQVREAVQGVGDGLGLRRVEQLGDGGEVEVLAAEPDRVAAAGGGGLAGVGRAEGGRVRGPGPRRGEHGRCRGLRLLGESAGLGEGLRLREHRGVPFELDVAGRPDAQTLLAALAGVTEKIGLVATQNTT